MPADIRLLADRYRLLSVFARGGMGQVWEASDELLGRTVAIKEVHFPADVPDEERAVMGERIMREAKLTARLTHRGIITIYDVVRVDERPYIVMELVRAPSLARQIDDYGPLPPREVAAIGLQLLDALRVAHAEGIVHRDVKPSNVLLAPDRVVLTDFGIATSESDATLTSTGLLIGSPTYMSPERLRGEGIGAPADLWSLGATLYASLEAAPPFRATTTMGTITAVLVDDPAPPHVTGPLREAVLGLLDKNVHTRLTGPEAAALLQAVLDEPVGVAGAGLEDAAVAPPATAPPVMAPAMTWEDPAHLPPLADVESGAQDGGSIVEPIRSFSFVAPPPGPAGATAIPGDDPPEGWADDESQQPNRRTVLLTVLSLLMAAGIIGLIAWTQFGGVEQSAGSTGPLTSNTTPSNSTDLTTPHQSKETKTKHHRKNPGGPATPPASTRTSRTKPTATTSASVVTTLPPTTVASTSARPPPTAPTTAAPTTAAPTTAAPTTAAPTTTAPTTTALPPTTGSGAPAGYQVVHDPLGFSVTVPAGWYRRVDGTRVDFVSPQNSAMYIRIDQKAQAGPSAEQAWRDYEPSLAANLSGYSRIRLESVPFRQWEAADLEFTWSGSNGTLHVLDRGFITNPRGFAILMSGPDATWAAQSLPVFQTAAASFRPTASP